LVIPASSAHGVGFFPNNGSVKRSLATAAASAWVRNLGGEEKFQVVRKILRLKNILIVTGTHNAPQFSPWPAFYPGFVLLWRGFSVQRRSFSFCVVLGGRSGKRPAL